MNQNLKSYRIQQIPYKRIYGRTTGSKELVLFWGASGIEVKVKSSEAWALIESDYDSAETWITVSVNGSTIARQSLQKGKQWICLTHNMNPQNECTVFLQRDIQPMHGQDNNVLMVHEIALPPEAQFLPVDKKDMHIEFIGDSISSGEGLNGAPCEMDFIPQNFGATKTYAVMCSRMLNASYDVISQSGWGVSYGWDGNTSSVMPPHYGSVCSLMDGPRQKAMGSTEPYEFKKSDFIVINLGTNDSLGISCTNYSGNREQKLIDDTCAFLKQIRSHNPDTPIVWCWGMIKIQGAPELIQKGIESYRNETGDNKIFTLEFDPMEQIERTPEDRGSRNHPGPATHRAAAEKLSAFIKSISK